MHSDKSISLQWKEFNVPVEKLNKTLASISTSNYDGIVCEPDHFHVMFKEIPTQEEKDTIINYWAAVTEAQFNPTLREIISKKINDASAFGRALILDFAVENVEQGITQSGKTAQVADYCADIQRYVESGSLYAAVERINDLIDAGVPAELSPFVTTERLTTYRDRISTFLTENM